LNKKNPEISKKLLQPSAKLWSLIGLFVVILCFSGLGFLSTRQWQENFKEDRILDLSVNSMTIADYSDDKPSNNSIAQVRLDIIKDVIRDSLPNPEDLNDRLALIDSSLLSSLEGDPERPGALPLVGIDDVILAAGIVTTPVPEETDVSVIVDKKDKPEKEDKVVKDDMDEDKPEKEDKPVKEDKPEKKDK
jgi:hypothetical protein